MVSRQGNSSVISHHEFRVEFQTVFHFVYNNYRYRFGYIKGEVEMSELFDRFFECLLVSFLQYIDVYLQYSVRNSKRFQ